MADTTDGGPMDEIERIILMSEEGGQMKYHPKNQNTSKYSNQQRYKGRKADQ
jgi:hypothetical protein